jgi:hypothetical protein
MDIGHNPEPTYVTTHIFWNLSNKLPTIPVFYTPPWVSMESSWTMVNFGEVCLVEYNGNIINSLVY